MANRVISVDNISKKYLIGDTASGSLGETVTNFFSKKLKRGKTEDFWALKDISFSVNQGEAIGVIGRNGAGKSTLLKVLSKITDPTKGRIEILGRVSSLLEVGTGFHPELTGKENIYLNGTILGMKKSEITNKFDEIVDFSGVEKFLETPIKRYSSGMKVRLAFAVAAHLEPEILIIDEVLAVGDADFQRKCLGKMEDVTHDGRTIIFVSHNMHAVKTLCPKSILLKDGMLIDIGETNDVISNYLDINTNSGTTNNFDPESIRSYSDVSFQLLNLNITQKGAQKIVFNTNESIEIEIAYRIKEPVKGVRVYFDILDNSGNLIIRSFNDEHVSAIPTLGPGNYSSKAILPKNLFAPKGYYLSISATIHNERNCLGGEPLTFLLSFESNSVINMAYRDTVRSLIQPEINWSNAKLEEL